MSCKVIAWSASAAALALVLSGCGKSHDSGPNVVNLMGAMAMGPGKPACDILTEAVAKKYLGPDAQLRRKAQPNPRMSQCQWGSQTGGVITVMEGPWGMIYIATPQDKPVAGLGDEAHVGPSGLFVKKGNRGLSISVIAESGEWWGKAADDMEANTEAAEKKVAPDLLANM